MVTRWTEADGVYTTSWQGLELVIRRDNEDKRLWRMFVNGRRAKLRGKPAAWASPKLAMAQVDDMVERLIRQAVLAQSAGLASAARRAYAC